MMQLQDIDRSLISSLLVGLVNEIYVPVTPIQWRVLFIDQLFEGAYNGVPIRPMEHRQ